MALEPQRARQNAYEGLLEQSEQRYRRLLEAVTTYTYSVRVEHGLAVSTIHSPWSLATTGYTPDDYRQDPHLWINMVHPDDREGVRARIGRVLRGESVPPLEHRVQCKDGREFPVDVSTRTVQVDTDTYIVGTVRDIRERRRIEGRLRDQEVQLLAAQSIQQSLLPDVSPTLPGFDIAGAMYPAEFAAGDFFDYNGTHLRSGRPSQSPPA